MRSGFTRRLSADERSLLERLVGELGPRLLAYVRRTYGGGPEAEDIVAEAFCRAAANITALRASQRRDLYMLTIARNLCRDRFRRSRPTVPADEHVQRGPGASTDPQESLAKRERLNQLREAIAGLPEPVREVVVLRLSTDLKFEEISEVLHIPLGTALSRMHAALEHLRKMLGSSDGS